MLSHLTREGTRTKTTTGDTHNALSRQSDRWTNGLLTPVTDKTDTQQKKFQFKTLFIWSLSFFFYFGEIYFSFISVHTVITTESHSLRDKVIGQPGQEQKVFGI